LNEWTDMIFDPCIVGFTFTQVVDCLQKLNLSLVGFELPAPPDVLLRYKAQYPDDSEMRNAKYLDEFEEKNPGVLKMSLSHISFTVQKL